MNVHDYFDETILRQMAVTQGTPLYVYSRRMLQERAAELMKLQFPFGATVRYAIKANNHPDIIRLLHHAGLQFDASSSYEAVELMGLGVPGESISLSSQQPAHNLPELLAKGVKYVATSMHQLELFAVASGRPSTVALRVNPGVGAGHNNRNTTGGANSSFGLWNAYVPDALQFASEKGMTIDRLHIHIGSGADPAMWGKMMGEALEIAGAMPDVAVLDIGGGFKIHRYGDEKEADMKAIGDEFGHLLQGFAAKTGRKLHLEIEPGTWIVGHASILLAEIVDIVDTGRDGHKFLRLNTGMNDFSRPTMYGSQHAISVLNDNQETESYIVVGHNCETGDIITTAPTDPEGIEPRELRRADIGDTLVIYDTGAYCRSMSLKGYNSYPNASEVFID